MMSLQELKDLYVADLMKTVTYNGRTDKHRAWNYKVWEDLPLCETIDLTDRNVWIWSDIHFGHKNIISYCNRPFMDTTEMDEALIANFNDYVGPDDVSIWVGDVSFRKDDAANALLERCNGYKILVIGNHDVHKTTLRNLNFDEIHPIYMIELPFVDLVFTHYPMDNLPKPMINVHGHLHDKLTDNDQHVSVCCEILNYHPIHLDELARIARTRSVGFEDEKF